MTGALDAPASRPYDFQRGTCAIVESKTGEQWWQHWRALEGAAAKYATGYYGEETGNSTPSS